MRKAVVIQLTDIRALLFTKEDAEPFTDDTEPIIKLEGFCLVPFLRALEIPYRNVISRFLDGKGNAHERTISDETFGIYGGEFSKWPASALEAEVLPSGALAVHLEWLSGGSTEFAYDGRYVIEWKQEEHSTKED